MTKERLGVDARDLVDALNDVAVQIRKLGVEKVAEKSGVKPGMIKKFIANSMKSKTSDVRKIREAVKALLSEASESSVSDTEPKKVD